MLLLRCPAVSSPPRPLLPGQVLRGVETRQDTHPPRRAVLAAWHSQPPTVTGTALLQVPVPYEYGGGSTTQNFIVSHCGKRNAIDRRAARLSC